MGSRGMRVILSPFPSLSFHLWLAKRHQSIEGGRCWGHRGYGLHLGPQSWSRGEGLQGIQGCENGASSKAVAEWGWKQQAVWAALLLPAK